MKKMTAAVIVLVSLVLFYAGSRPKANEAVPKMSDPAPVTLKQEPAETAAIASVQAVKKGKYKVTFIELGSVRCIPCKMMMPIMKEIEEKYGDEVKVVFYDVWTQEGRPYADTYRVTGIPTQVFLDAAGKEYFRHTGFFPMEKLLPVLKKQGVKID